MEAFKCQGCEAIVNSDYRNENTKLDYCKLCEVPKVEDLQEKDLVNIKQKGYSHNE